MKYKIEYYNRTEEADGFQFPLGVTFEVVSSAMIPSFNIFTANGGIVINPQMRQDDISYDNKLFLKFDTAQSRDEFVSRMKKRIEETVLEWLSNFEAVEKPDEYIHIP